MFSELKATDCEKLCGGSNPSNNTTNWNYTYKGYAYAYQSQYANNAGGNNKSFNVTGKNASGTVLIGQYAGYTEAPGTVIYSNT
jgi:hypothetical protein